jgi:hypothetical protein
MVFHDRPVYQEEHAAQLIMASRVCSLHKGRIHLRRPVDRPFAFPLQSDGGPYITGKNTGNFLDPSLVDPMRKGSIPLYSGCLLYSGPQFSLQITGNQKSRIREFHSLIPCQILRFRSRCIRPSPISDTDSILNGRVTSLNSEVLWLSGFLERNFTISCGPNHSGHFPPDLGSRMLR